MNFSALHNIQRGSLFASAIAAVIIACVEVRSHGKLQLTALESQQRDLAGDVPFFLFGAADVRSGFR